MPGGRPLTLTKELIRKFVAAFRRVWYLEPAAGYCGIHRSHLYRWLRHGVKAEKAHAAGKELSPDETLYLELWGAYKKELFRLEAECLTGMRAAAKSDPRYWVALAWLLERRWGKRWGKKESDELVKLRAEFDAYRQQHEKSKKN